VLDQLWQHGFVGNASPSGVSGTSATRGGGAPFVHTHTGGGAAPPEWVGTGGGHASASSPASHTVVGGAAAQRTPHVHAERVRGGGGGVGAAGAAHSSTSGIEHCGSGMACRAYPALHEVLGLVTNLVVGCEGARAAVCGEGSPTLLQRILGLLFEVGVRVGVHF